MQGAENRHDTCGRSLLQPTMVVFISCQKIILRGIIIPSMK